MPPTPMEARPTTLAPQDEVMLLNGMGGYGYSACGVGMPMMFDTIVRSLTGIAIRYRDGH